MYSLDQELAFATQKVREQRAVIATLQSDLAAAKAELARAREAAIVPVLSRQEFGTPGRVEFYRCVFCNHDARTPDIDHDSDCVVREAGYLGGGE